jgi:uncharacterized protein (TIGR00255 family)
VFVNLPGILRNDENEFAAMVKKTFTRGRIELNIDLFDWNTAKPVSINGELLKKYYREILAVHKSLGIGEPFRFESILNLDGVTHKERSSISPESRRDIINSIEAVIKKTADMRKKEGTALRKDIASLLSLIGSDVNRIRLLSKKAVEEKKKLLVNRLGEITGGSIDNNRLYSEISILAEKLDINEELVRLDDHLKKFKIIIKDKGQIGRKLDFLCQELFREINTIASKSSNSAISQHVVEVKNNIEKIREQCRNVV